MNIRILCSLVVLFMIASFASANDGQLADANIQSSISGNQSFEGLLLKEFRGLNVPKSITALENAIRACPLIRSTPAHDKDSIHAAFDTKGNLLTLAITFFNGRKNIVWQNADNPLQPAKEAVAPVEAVTPVTEVIAATIFAETAPDIKPVVVPQTGKPPEVLEVVVTLTPVEREDLKSLKVIISSPDSDDFSTAIDVRQASYHPPIDRPYIDLDPHEPRQLYLASMSLPAKPGSLTLLWIVLASFTTLLTQHIVKKLGKVWAKQPIGAPSIQVYRHNPTIRPRPQRW